MHFFLNVCLHKITTHPYQHNLLLREHISTKADEVNAIKQDWSLLSCCGKYMGTGYLQETISRGMAQLL